MALDFGIELRRREGPADLVAFQLGHVDAIGRKPAHRLVKRRRHVSNAEDKGGDPPLPVTTVGHVGLAAHDHEPRCVVGGVLDVFGKDIETVDLRRQAGGDRCLRRIAKIAHLARGACRVRARLRNDAPRPQEVPALAQPHDVAVRSLDLLQRRAPEAHQLEADRHEMFGDDLERRCGKKVVDVRHPARDRVFHRDHGELRLTRRGRLEDVLECWARHRLEVRINLVAGDVGVGAQLPLEGNLAHAPLCPCQAEHGNGNRGLAAPARPGLCVISPGRLRLPHRR